MSPYFDFGDRTETNALYVQLTAASRYPLERQTQFDMRFAKTLKVGGTRYDLTSASICTTY